MHIPSDAQNTIELLLADRPTSPHDLPYEVIRPNPFQAREHFDPDALEELANSLREYGLFERLKVRPDPSEKGFYQLLYGERRLRAAKLAGLIAIPVSV